MEVIKLTNDNLGDVIKRAVEILIAGGLVVFPTETCYGLGVDTTNQEAVDKLLKFKRRPQGKAISIAVENIEMAEKYVEINEEARNLYRNFLPGPMTIVSKSKKQKNERGSNLPLNKGEQEGVLSETTPDPSLSMRGLATGLASENKTLGVRIPDYPLVIEIIKQLGNPITATSANISSLPNPYSLNQWQKQTAKKSQELIDLFIDAGELPRRAASTVVDTTNERIAVLRQGEMDLITNSDVFITKSEDETKELAKMIVGENIRGILESGLVIGLQGDLGTGKTRFAQGVALALGISENIKSPTFTIVEEYEYDLSKFYSTDSQLIPTSRLPRVQNDLENELDILNSRKDDNDDSPESSLSIDDSFFFHLDVWRLEDESEILNLGLNEMLKPGNVVVIEWFEKVKDIVGKVTSENNVVLIEGMVERLGETVRRWSWAQKNPGN